MGLEDSNDRTHIAAVNEALRGPGVALVSLKFIDTSSDYLQRLVLGLRSYHNHGPPIEHSATRGWFWDVRPMEKAINRARSESSLNFPWHTDCSYESRPPQFFALHVLHADQHGGGTLLALNALQVLRKLESSAFETLSRPEFRITVPPEFSKGIPSIDGSVLNQAGESSDLRIRFRSDIIRPLSNRAEKALKGVRRLLAPGSEADIEDIKLRFTPEDLPSNTIVLMDNSRWLHARTEVKDPKRHLRRIRWGRRAFEVGDEGKTMAFKRG